MTSYTVICVRNEGYESSLELRKIYQAIRDPLAVRRGMVRVIDESGEDCLYPADRFVAVRLPGPVRKAMSLIACR